MLKMWNKIKKTDWQLHETEDQLTLWCLWADRTPVVLWSLGHEPEGGSYRERHTQEGGRWVFLKERRSHFNVTELLNHIHTPPCLCLLFKSPACICTEWKWVSTVWNQAALNVSDKAPNEQTSITFNATLQSYFTHCFCLRFEWCCCIYALVLCILPLH